MAIVLHKDLKVDTPWSGARSRTLVSKEMGSEAVTALEVTLEPGAQIPLHIHPTHEEAILIVEGVADGVIEGETRTVEAPATMVVAKGLRHQVVNNSGAPVRLLGIFPTVNVTREYV